MPLFSNKFSLKKIPTRKTASLSTVRRELEANQEFGIEYGDIKLHLGDQECLFENGQWIVGKGYSWCQEFFPIGCMTRGQKEGKEESGETPTAVRMNAAKRATMNHLSKEDGKRATAGNRSHKDLAKLKKQNQQLIEENNLLKIKVELLLDMLAETTAEFHQQEVELEEAKKTLHRR